ncbi:MAG: hypothetical protein ACRCZY_03420 [Phocaeicola sp.]
MGKTYNFHSSFQCFTAVQQALHSRETLVVQIYNTRCTAVQH